MLHFHLCLKALIIFISVLIPASLCSDDRSALLALRSHLLSYNDRHDIISGNWSDSTHVCDWIGVTCGGRRRRVTALNLDNMNLVGTFPPHVGNLSFLVKVNISFNKFHDPLPRELALLPRLKQIILAFNKFGQVIPSWLGLAPRVEVLDLSNNHFTGSISSNIFNISSLNFIDLSSNKLSGTLPVDMCENRILRLNYLNLSRNQLKGHLPSALFKCKELQELYLFDNNFGASIPREIGNLSMLSSLDLGANSLEGKIPQELGSLQSLETISLHHNNLIGSIPSGILNSSSLRGIYLEHNSLTGSLPIAMCDGPSVLEVFSAGANNIQGSIPTGMKNCTLLRELNLSSNNLKGEIPYMMGQMLGLEMISLHHNGFTGSIPSNIFNRFIRRIYFDFNSLTGTLPLHMCDVVSRLEVLSAGSNNIVGSIPTQIKYCTSLRQLDLNSNGLSGEIPDEMASLSDLESINLSSNNLSGQIPVMIFNISKMKVFSVVNNRLSGELPGDGFFNLPNLEELYLDFNSLSGPIPVSICNCSELTILDMSSNSFNGLIPRDLGNLRHLQWLNLEFNSLKAESSALGLEFLNSLANCKKLEYLGFSRNPINGIIPDSIGNLSALVHLLGERCKLHGMIPEGIGNLNKLISLKLHHNELIGSIPPSIRNLKQLQFLSLRINKLQGSIPVELCQLPNLGFLHLGVNGLSGAIPACIGNVGPLKDLGLAFNKLVSIIPATLWSLDLLHLNLSGNALEGELSSKIGNMRAAIIIDLSNNLLEGALTYAMGSLQSLQILHMQHNKFEGQIPKSLGSIFSLKSLDLSNNNLSGTIPVSLIKLSGLKHLNLSFNQLEGEIPNGGPFANFSSQSFLMNKKLCGEARFLVPRCAGRLERAGREHFWLKYGLPTFLGIVVFDLLLLVFLRWRKKEVKLPTQDEFTILSIRRISQEEIFRATDGLNDSNLLGHGGSGFVYKGILSDGVNVAIKVFNGAFKSFDVECNVLRSARHRNLVKIISSCCNEDLGFKALVLEYYPNGSLDKWLYSHNHFLTILQRLNISIDIASALDYLHHHHQSTPILHCDLKPGNILLDDDMVAHISDFGISKLMGDEEFVRQTRTLATIGYMAPEYGSEGIVSTSTDVYSFGILLMEIFTRKRPWDDFFVKEMNLKRWIEESLPHALNLVVDANLLVVAEEHSDAEMECLLAILQLALLCTKESPKERIIMEDVVTVLAKIKKMWQSGARGMHRLR